MRGKAKINGLKGIVNISRLSLIAWLLLNTTALFYLQKNLSYHYSLKEQAIKTVFQAKSLSLQLAGKQVSANRPAEELIVKLQRNLQVFAEGGIVNDGDLVVGSLPENLRLRSQALTETINQLQQSNKEAHAVALAEEGDQLLAGFTTLTQQAEERFFIGMLCLAIANLILLLLGVRLVNSTFIKRVLRLKNEATVAELGEPIETEKPDEIDEVTETLQVVKQEISLAASLVKQSGEGNLSNNEHEGQHPITSPLFAALKGMQNQMKEIAEADRQRSWTSQGLAQFVDILRSKDDDLEALAHTILAELVKYMGANQGALYLVTQNEKQETILRQEACFAFNRRKWLEKEFHPGDGMIGQAYLEKETIYLTEIPQNYINITSGLGDAPPSNVLIVPLTINEEVMGVLELASFKQIPQYKIQFTEKLGENIAATLANVRNSLETRKLLEESQLMSENLRAQEEEMRQNMEELTTTQEELNRKMKEGERVQFELNARMQALNETALLSESDLYGNITYVNTKFCEVAKYTQEEVMGKPHNILRHPDNPKELFREMWATLKAGRVFNGQYPNKAKDGSTYWVDATIVPVLGEDGKPVKYIGVRFDMTEQRQKEAEIKNLLDESEQQMAQMQAQEEVMREAFEGKAKQEEELQQNMEEMRAQEEELRQNMEEMQAIQEELHSKMMENDKLKKELDSRVAALDEAAILTESDLYGNILYANRKFCEVAKYTADEVMNKPHNIIRHPDVPKHVFKQLWDTIKAGKVFKGRYPNLAKDGSTYWVDATIVPVLNEEGQPEKYIGIRFLIEKKEEQLIQVHQAEALN